MKIIIKKILWFLLAVFIFCCAGGIIWVLDGDKFIVGFILTLGFMGAMVLCVATFFIFFLLINGEL